MSIRICEKNGKAMWKLGTWSAGKLTRQFFATRGEAEKAQADAQRQKVELGKGYKVLTAREKSEVGAILAEIAAAGMTLDQVWRLAQAAPALGKTCTLKKAVEDVIAAKIQSNCHPRHIGNIEWYLGHFIKGREFADVASIGVNDLNAWFSGRDEAPKSKKGHVALLSLLFQHCWRQGYIKENPVRRLDPIRVTREIPSVLTHRQCQQAIAWAHCRRPALLGWLALVLFAGLRPDAEADTVAWDDIDLARGRLMIRKSKVRTPRIVDLAFCPPAGAWLKVAKDASSPLGLSHAQRRRYLRELREYLGLDLWPQDVMRHTAASNLLAYHQDAGKVAAFLGNSAGVLIRDYKALIFSEDAARWMRLLPR
jgi:hypothetical protein